MLRFALDASLLVCLLAAGRSLTAADQPRLAGMRRVVFLGDSITYAGQYIDFIETFLRVKDPTLRCEFLNLGLPSETVSGLTEPGHAGGQFPRPDLRERLGRVLEQTRPDLIVACYGMNDGIYHPFSEARFDRFRQGMELLRDRAAKAGAEVLHVTPPVLDPVPIRGKTLPGGLAEYRQPYAGYDEVLDRYSEWLLAQRGRGWDVVDVHGPMKRYLASGRRRDPGFRLAADGVHLGGEGHWLMAREILSHWGIPAGDLGEARAIEQVLATRPHGLQVLDLVRRRQRLLRDAWLTATGHARPGMDKGLSIKEAERHSQELQGKIRELLTPPPGPPVRGQKPPGGR
jgi:lysophospholipase L1-like esterase